ncbi:MAG: DUF4097 family beta strand repeat protein [bacterium]|nr:DUF4097 family beta strand repeat protein [bacterium]
MRRGSLVGPLLLILIGGLFLLSNISPDIGILSLLAQYWPFLLVGWGILRLVELVSLSMRELPLPRAGLSGSEWALAVLICLIGSSADFAGSRLPNARITMHGVELFGESFDFRSEASAPAEQASRIRVENLHGNVRVVGADTTEVKVESRTTVRAFDSDGARKANEDCPLEVVAEGDLVSVRTNHDRRGGGSKITTDLEITVPRGVSIEGRGRTGDYDIANISGDVDVESDEAGIRLAEIGGSARIDLDHSDIVRIVNLEGNVNLEGRGRDVEIENVNGQVTIEGSYHGELSLRNIAMPVQFDSSRTELRIEKTPGRVRIALGSLTGNNLVGPIRLKTRSRDVEFSDFTEELMLELERGDVELRPGKSPVARMDVEVNAGSIDVLLPQPGGFGLLAKTERGEIINEFGPSLTIEEQQRGAALAGPEGRDTTIRLKTERGNIVVRKTGGGGQPPAPAPAPAPAAPPDPASLTVEQH